LTRSVLLAGDDEAKRPHFEQAEEVLERLEEVLNKGSEGKTFFWRRYNWIH